VGVKIRKADAGALSPEEAARLSALIHDGKLGRAPLGAVHPSARNAKGHPRRCRDLRRSC